MNRRLLFVVVGVLAACLICCGVLYFVALPRARDQVNDGIRDGVASEVAGQIASAGSAAPGTYVITQDELLDRIRSTTSGNDANVEDFTLTITPSQIEVGFDSSSQSATYTGQVAAVDGRLEVQNMSTSSGLLNFLFPADDVAGAIEDGVNEYLDANGLVLNGLTMGDGQITLDVGAR
jgi:hypothetical protein